MRLPESWTERIPALEQLEEPWEPFPRIALFAWIAFYLFFLNQQARHGMLPGLMDGVFVPIHEGGHLLFRIAGEFLMIAGGTFLQLFAPFALATYFAFRRQPQGVAFCSFFFFQQFLPISTYMADARDRALPLVTLGAEADDPNIGHDWNYIFDHLGLLEHDRQIGHFTHYVAVTGSFAVVAWLVYRWRQSSE